jgi:serine phosphatase RsbU (regulator of sigma subunit)
VEIEGVAERIVNAFKGFIFQSGDWIPLDQLKASGQPVTIHPDTPQPVNAPMRITDFGEAVLLPLFAKGEVMGALLIGQRDGVEPLSNRKIELVSGIANQAALAIESAQLFLAQQEDQWVTRALLTVAESVNSTRDLTETLTILVRITPMLVGVKRCAVMQWEPDAHCFVGGAAYGLTPEAEVQFAGLVMPADSGEWLRQLATGSGMVTAGEGMNTSIPRALHMIGAPALLGLPLVAKGTLVGTMLVDHPGAEVLADERRMAILTGTAQQAALAIETARLQADSVIRQRIERELEVAQGIQRSFLPQQLPTIAGWDLSVFYRAARQVGGDFYDFIPLKSGKWGIVIADVSDKGVPAALFMVLCRTNLRAAAFSRDLPVDTLLRVNELLLADSRSDLFVTCWYGVLDPATGEISYANAGHNPPIIVRADGMSEELTGHGIALGVIDPIKLEERRITLRPGDTLLPYTDGVTEAIRGDLTEFGVVGLQSTAAAVRSQPAGNIMKRVVQAVDTFTAGEAQFDDLTLIVLKHDGESNGKAAPSV